MLNGYSQNHAKIKIKKLTIEFEKDINICKKSDGLNLAGPRCLEDYFQKGALLGQKAALNLWHVDTRPNSQKLFPSFCRSFIFCL